MNEVTVDFMFSMPCLIALSFIIVYIAWRVLCQRKSIAEMQMTRLTDVTKIRFQDGGFAQVLFRDGTTRLIAKKYLVLKDHNGQMFSIGPSLERCELIVSTDGTQMRGLVVEVPALLYGEPDRGKTPTHYSSL